MQQRQLRLGDILDDYCPREHRLTNHAVVAMVGPDVKQTRCTTCEADHEYKHAKVPRQRRKSDTPAALFAPTQAGGPKRVPHESEAPAPTPETEVPGPGEPGRPAPPPEIAAASPAAQRSDQVAEPDEPAHEAKDVEEVEEVEEGPVHRPLIRATLPRGEGQPPPQRPAPDFTIRQPGGRPNRFRQRQQRGGGQQFFGNRPGGNAGGGGFRQASGRPPHQHHGHGQGPASSRPPGRHHGPPHKRSK